MSLPDALCRLLSARDQLSLVSIASDGAATVGPPPPGTLLPGSFAPLHRGHEQLAEVVAQLLGQAVVFELSVVNVDKPPLDRAEVQRRMAQFRGRWPVVLTRAPTFVEKARLLPGRAFAIGYDTAVRLVDPRYYGGEQAAAVAALDEMRALGCRFLVAGRWQAGAFRTLADVRLQSSFADMFESIPEERFRVDLSSSDLREGR